MSNIAGYRKLTEDEVKLINELKEVEQKLADHLLFLERRALPTTALRWLAMARTHLETGFMFAVKAVTQPEGGLGNRPPVDG